MKVSVKRAFCTAMSAMLTLAGAAGLVSCGDGGESDPNTLIIDAFEGGYGVDWLYAIADKFEEKNEGVSVRIYPTEDDSMFGTSLLSGRLTSDIVFERYPYWERILRPTTIGGTTYECLYEDLTDIYTTDIPGEDVTIEEKLIDG